MKRKHVLFALLLLSFSFLSGTLSAQNQPSEKKYVWFDVNNSYSYVLYGTAAEALPHFQASPSGRVAIGYDLDRRGTIVNPFWLLIVLPEGLQVVTAGIFTTNGQLSGNAVLIDKELYK